MGAIVIRTRIDEGTESAEVATSDCLTSRRFRKSFNCRYNPRMDYVPCLLMLTSSEKWRSPLFGATGNLNHQILPYDILFLTFINTNVFYSLSFKFPRKLVKTMAFSFKGKLQSVEQLL